MKNNNSLDENKLLLNHEYDGIQELDHPLPFWWKATFYLTILFGVPYFIYYVWGGGKTLQQVYQEKMVLIEEAREVARKDAAIFRSEEFKKFEPEASNKGIALFKENCVACHLENGIGDIGPNLTDQYWIHGRGTAENIYQVVYNGVLEKGMPVWGEVFSKEDIYRLVAYVRSLHGLNLKGKAPQGEKIVPHE